MPGDSLSDLNKLADLGNLDQRTYNLFNKIKVMKLRVAGS
jgi:hypothetical protein